MPTPLRYLSAKLFLILLVALLVVFSVHTYINLRTTSAFTTGYIHDSAERASDLILRSTRYSMLVNRKEDVQQIIGTLSVELGFVGVNIYNKTGQVIFSTDSTQIGRKVDMRAEACYMCHNAEEPLRSVPTTNRVRVFRTRDHGRVLGLISSIANEPACANDPCHAHPADQTVLGVLDVKMTLASVDKSLAVTQKSLIASSLVTTLFISVLSGVFIYRMIRKPISQLSDGMTTIAGGDLSARIPIRSNDEIGELAQSFNTMVDDLQKARGELEEWARTLEDRIAKKTRELEQVQAQVVHMEKMASLGKLSASIAHEINNPLFGILTYAKLSLRELDPDRLDAAQIPTIKKYLSIIQHESSRCGDIVKNLLDFARQTGGEFTKQHLNQIVDQTLVLLAHHFQMAQIKVTKEFTEEDDEFFCDPKQIQQAIVAPCINSVEAMPEGGELVLKTWGEVDTVSVQICDTGVGIESSVLPHIFEPFFTTKEGKQGESALGLGLGLAVVYGIVQRHQGHIDVQSEPNKGTKLTITLPREPRPEDVPAGGV
jgi:two-component system NtrC family sensor kinase